MDYDLVVRHAFGDYKLGDRITDRAAVSAVLASNPHLVSKVVAAVPEKEPDKAPEAKPAPQPPAPAAKA